MTYHGWLFLLGGGIAGVLLNRLAQDFASNKEHKFVASVFAFLGTIIPYVAYFLCFSYINNNNSENILKVNLVSVTEIAFWAGIVTFASSLSRYTDESYQAVKNGTFFLVGVAVALIFFVTGFSKSDEIFKRYDETYQIKVISQQVVEVEEIPIYSTASDGMVKGNIDGNGNFLGFIISGTIDTVPVYKYLCRNEQGALVSRYVLADEKSTMIFDTLSDNEAPYLRIEYTYEVVTDNNVEPAEVTKKLVDTKYMFYVPSNAVESKLEF